MKTIILFVLLLVAVSTIVIAGCTQQQATQPTPQSTPLPTSPSTPIPTV